MRLLTILGWGRRPFMNRGDRQLDDQVWSQRVLAPHVHKNPFYKHTSDGTYNPLGGFIRFGIVPGIDLNGEPDLGMDSRRAFVYGGEGS